MNHESFAKLTSRTRPTELHPPSPLFVFSRQVHSRNCNLHGAIRRSFGRPRDFSAFHAAASTLSLYILPVGFHAEIIYGPRTLGDTLYSASFQRGSAVVCSLYYRPRDSRDLPVCIKPLFVYGEDIRSRRVARTQARCSCCTG